MDQNRVFHTALIGLMLLLAGPGTAASRAAERRPTARNLIFLICDGCGARHYEAANKYRNSEPQYQNWQRFRVSTYPAGGSYDPPLAWSEFGYVQLGPTDSAAAATALFSGKKTTNRRIAVSPKGQRLFTLVDKARVLGKAVGVVTTVAINHATPAAWYAHNEDRYNVYAIAAEGLWGDPREALRTVFWSGMLRQPSLLRDWWQDRFAGGRGSSLPPVDVMLGTSSPGFSGEVYFHDAFKKRLANESGNEGKHFFFDGAEDHESPAGQLLKLAGDPQVKKLVGLINHTYQRADGSGHETGAPSLSEMTRAALLTLGRSPRGFVLLVEGGAVDWASHANQMDEMIGELLEFDEAVKAVIEWVEDATNLGDWENTLAAVTSDHETGHLSAGPGTFPDEALGEVSPRTIALERAIAGTDRRASWEDSDGDGQIDNNEELYWMWNSSGHTNVLVPLFVRGPGEHSLSQYSLNEDRVLGPYIDNTDVFRMANGVMVSERADANETDSARGR